MPPRGLEPRTNGLKVRCSTVELEGRDRLKTWKKTFPRFGPEPGGRGYRLCLARHVADSASGRGRVPRQWRAGVLVVGRERSVRDGLRTELTVEVRRVGVADRRHRTIPMCELRSRNHRIAVMKPVVLSLRPVHLSPSALEG